MEPRFAKGTDEAALTAALTPLLARWALSADGGAIERTFKFKTFAKTWVSSIARNTSLVSTEPSQD